MSLGFSAVLFTGFYERKEILLYERAGNLRKVQVGASKGQSSCVPDFRGLILTDRKYFFSVV